MAELKELGINCGRLKVRKIMDEMGLVAIQPKCFKPRTTESRHGLGYNENLLLNEHKVDSVNRVWVGDITYISLSGKFAYLAVLMDRYSRRIVSWDIALRMGEALVIKPLKDAIRERQPAPNLVHHTDRGGQYASKQYRAILKRANMKQSMSRAGDCYDNAFMESCFGTLKTELEVHEFENLKHARTKIRDYFNYYNNVRRHSALDYQPPTRFENTARK